MRNRIFAVLAAIFLSGCSAFGVYLEHGFRPAKKEYVTPLGIKIVNRSRNSIDDGDLRLWTFLVERGFVTFRECAGQKNFPDQELRAVNVVLLPAERIFVFGDEVEGFTDLRNIYLRRDRFNMFNVRHEYAHIYLWLTNRRAFGDLFHKDGLFNKCSYIAGEQ